jgi:hypothetical protein
VQAKNSGQAYFVFSLSAPFLKPDFIADGPTGKPPIGLRGDFG